MNRSLEVFTKLYKPFKLIKYNNVYIAHSMEGSYVIKLNPKIDYKKLYKYLYSRSFNYVPSLSLDSRDDMVVFDYIEDTIIDCEQRIDDLISIVSLLHNKTSYYKDVSNDKYKEIYEMIRDNILYIESYYEEWFDSFFIKEYYSPSEYLFLRNYSYIYDAISYAKDNLDIWYSKIGDMNRQRVVLVHNNLSLDHYIKSDSDYLISWDNYVFDTPILDLYRLYLNEWENVSFKDVFNHYNSAFELLIEEKMLLNVLLCIPFKIDDNSEYNRCRNIRRLINYLDRTSKILFDI